MPTRGERVAPVFDSAKPRELTRFFADLERLFTRATVADAEEKKSYATSYLSVRDQDAWESRAEFADATKTYEEFKAAVYKLYPAANPNKKYTVAFLEDLVEQTARKGIRSLTEFSEFNLDFTAAGAYLVKQKRISALDQSRAFIRAMQPPTLWARIEARLAIKLPDHDQDEVYDLKDLEEAAMHVLQGVAFNQLTSVAPSPPVQPKSEPDMAVLVTAVTAAVIDALSKNSALANRGQNQQSYTPRSRNCHYCGQESCIIPTCPSVAQDVEAGLVQRNVNGKVVLPSGAFVPSHIQGATIRARVQEWHRQNPNQRAAAQLMVDVNPAPVFTLAHARLQPVAKCSGIAKNLRGCAQGHPLARVRFLR
ncbi:hypothetical protein C8F01DRAFT_1260836 [Mycena amicta]|nr:hypothetical protein C8F01DRAFT_1260836 [Mycena amicta]